MLTQIMDNFSAMEMMMQSNDTDNPLYANLGATNYDQYLFFAVCSALLGLPSNILLLVILIRIGLFSRRQSGLLNHGMNSTGSFERFLFEVVFIDTMLVIYHFVDNFLSYIHEDRSVGQHYLIHVSDFCCKFFTYIAKMSVLLTTWLLLFLIINQLILTIDHNNNKHAFWHRGLYYVNAKYSTVFLVFFFSVYNIYPIEVLKYQQKKDLNDYQEGGVPGMCSTSFEGKSKRLLNATNYGYTLLGVAIPCVVILVISIIVIYRTCRNTQCINQDSNALHYIAATIGICHSMFNLPARFSDVLLLVLSPYDRYFPYVINFNHEAQSFISLSYGYKCFICIVISRRFRLHAKSLLCFLIENKYEDRHTIDMVSTCNDRQQVSRGKKRRHHRCHHHHHHPYSSRISVDRAMSSKFSFSHLNRDDFRQYTTSESTYWIRPYFTQHEKRHQLRPCGRSMSCHQISTSHSSQSSPAVVVVLPKDISPAQCYASSSNRITNIALPNGNYIHLPLPQKHRSSSALAPSNRTRVDSPSAPVVSRPTTLFLDGIRKTTGDRTHTHLSSSHLY